MTDHHTKQLALYLNARDSREYGTATWNDLDLAGQEAYLTDATAIVAAMKALGWTLAHTATDGERKAMATLLDEELSDVANLLGRDRVLGLADAVLGFRRSEVPEPSAEDVVVTLTPEAVEANRQYIERSQGEPSDAQVDTALEAFACRDGSLANREDMRAALRAAAEMGGEHNV